MSKTLRFMVELLGMVVEITAGIGGFAVQDSQFIAHDSWPRRSVGTGPVSRYILELEPSSINHQQTLCL